MDDLPPIWIGSLAIFEQPGSPDLERDSSGLTVTRVYEGPYDELRANVPAVDSVMTDILDSPKVERAKLTSLEGGVGRMVITGRREYSGGETTEEDEPVYEVEWGQLDKPLLSHPRYLAAGVNQINAAGYSIASFVEEWRKAATAEEQKAVYAKIQNTLGGGAYNTFQEIISKISAGVESYIVPAPVLRITTRSPKKPTTTALGKRGAPAGFPGIPPGYEWLGTADRAIRQGRNGKWERIREWTGADKWDPDIYPDGGSSA